MQHKTARVYPENFEQHYFDYIDWKTSDHEILMLHDRPNNKYVADVMEICPGTANVWAEIDGVSSEKFSITVKQPKATIKNKPSNNSLYKGSTHTLSYVSDPSDATIIWDSSNDNVATIDKNGKITAKAPGTVVISIDVEYGTYSDFSDSFVLNIDYPPATSIKITNLPTNNLLCVGDTHQLDYSLSPDNAFEEVSWTSSAPEVISVNSKTGKLTAKKAGIATITVTTKETNKKNGKTIEVKPLLIYQTKDIPRLKYCEKEKEYITAKDIEYGLLTKNELVDDGCINYEIDYEEEWHIMYLKMLADGMTVSGNKDIAYDMIEHFLSGDGTDYRNANLNDVIFRHEEALAYQKNVVAAFHDCVNSKNGDISLLEYNFSNRSKNPIRKYFYDNEILQPKFNTLLDYTNGIGFCVHGLWGNQLEVTSYNIVENKYFANIKITYYDHFGLDSEDLGLDNFEDFLKNQVRGFRSWYTLQHYNKYTGKYKPFVTYMEREIQISGQFE